MSTKTIIFDNVDRELLYKQYIELQVLLENDQDHVLWGLVEMIGDELHEW
jgi:hypothetical protein